MTTIVQNNPNGKQTTGQKPGGRSLPRLRGGARSGVPLFLQLKQVSGENSRAVSKPSRLAAAIGQSKQGGSTLPDASKARFESSLGTGLSKVRIHDGPKHHQLAKSLNAKAFTVGSDIYFGAGRYRPGSSDGDRLLAHELTHVAQQSTDSIQAKALEPGLAMGETGDRYEQEADRVADELASDSLTTPLYARNGIYSSPPMDSPTSGNVIQRDEDDEQQGFDYSLIPPSLAYRYGPFGMSADTSAAQLSYFTDEGRANLGYQYGGDLFYSTNMDGFRSRFGVNPQSGVGSMSFGGAHRGFNFGVGGNTVGNFNLNLGYGAPLLPMPHMLGQQAGAAWQGASATGGALPDFASDPMAAYEANRENIGAMSTFGGSLGNIYGQQGQGGLPFGAGLNISYNPEQRWVFGAGVQGSF